MMMRCSVLAVLALLVGCGGAIAEDSTSTDLPDDVHAVADGLAVDGANNDDGPDHADDHDGDHHHGRGEHEGHKKGHKKKHPKLFQALDRLDGAEDGKITLAALPAQVPAKLVDKLKELDTDQSGDVSRDEAHAACARAKGH